MDLKQCGSTGLYLSVIGIGTLILAEHLHFL